MSSTEPIGRDSRGGQPALDSTVETAAGIDPGDELARLNNKLIITIDALEPFRGKDRDAIQRTLAQLQETREFSHVTDLEHLIEYSTFGERQLEVSEAFYDGTLLKAHAPFTDLLPASFAALLRLAENQDFQRTLHGMNRPVAEILKPVNEDLTLKERILAESVAAYTAKCERAAHELVELVELLQEVEGRLKTYGFEMDSNGVQASISNISDALPDTFADAASVETALTLLTADEANVATLYLEQLQQEVNSAQKTLMELTIQQKFSTLSVRDETAEAESQEGTAAVLSPLERNVHSLLPLFESMPATSAEANFEMFSGTIDVVLEPLIDERAQVAAIAEAMDEALFVSSQWPKVRFQKFLEERFEDLATRNVEARMLAISTFISDDSVAHEFAEKTVSAGITARNFEFLCSACRSADLPEGILVASLMSSESDMILEVKPSRFFEAYKELFSATAQLLEEFETEAPVLSEQARHLLVAAHYSGIAALRASDTGLDSYFDSLDSLAEVVKPHELTLEQVVATELKFLAPASIEIRSVHYRTIYADTVSALRDTVIAVVPQLAPSLEKLATDNQSYTLADLKRATRNVEQIKKSGVLEIPGEGSHVNSICAHRASMIFDTMENFDEYIGLLRNTLERVQRQLSQPEFSKLQIQYLPSRGNPSVPARYSNVQKLKRLKRTLSREIQSIREKQGTASTSPKVERETVIKELNNEMYAVETQLPTRGNEKHRCGRVLFEILHQISEHPTGLTVENAARGRTFKAIAVDKLQKGIGFLERKQAIRSVMYGPRGERVPRYVLSETADDIPAHYTALKQFVRGLLDSSD